jgi:drug/metabolite transporter (DMT)-like permease
VSDFVGGIAARRVSALRVVLVSYPIALGLLTVLAGIVGGQLSGAAVLWGTLCGVSQAFGIWWFYAALGAGPISVVSPLTAILVAGVPVAVGVVLGDRPGVVAIAGVAVALVAVVLVSRGVTDEPLARRESSPDEPLARRESSPDEDVTTHRFTRTVAWLTVGSGLAFGLSFVVIHEAPHDAKLWPLVFARLSATLLVIGIAAVGRQLRPPSGVPLRLAVTAGLIDTISNVAMLLALQASLLSLAGVLISLYPASTVALALVVLKERVTRWQVVGMVAALAAVGMIAAG